MPAVLALLPAPTPPPSWSSGWTITVTYDEGAPLERRYVVEMYDGPYQQIWAEVVARASGATAREAMLALHVEPMRVAS